jgi:hypothetical protein
VQGWGRDGCRDRGRCRIRDGCGDGCGDRGRDRGRGGVGSGALDEDWDFHDLAGSSKWWHFDA